MAISMEQLEALLGASDITEQEKMRALLESRGQSMLNQMPRIQGQGLGSQLGRAGYGVAGALNNYSSSKMSPQITQSKQDLFSRLLRTMKKRPEMPSNYYGGLENDIGD